MATVGFVGLGTMGGTVTVRLLDAGHTVHGWNRTREKAQWLVDRGLVLEDSPRAVAEKVDVLFSMVTNTKALDAVSRGPDGILAGLKSGQVWVDSTTGSPSNSRALAADVEALGARLLDAPISGAPITLEEGKASIMVGGDQEAFEKVKAILEDVGPIVRRVGDNGQALLLKIAINLSLHVQMTAFSEGLLLAEKAGIDKEVAVEAMLNSVIASPMIKYRGPFVLGHPEGDAWFDCNMMQKDMQLALDAGRELDVPMPTTAVSNELLTAARGMGLDKYDFAVVYDVLASMAGVKGSVA
jgi:3-hydroxyisobutyrate dehydrogenase-like beta-hydroxyacid dehydrogenase